MFLTKKDARHEMTLQQKLERRLLASECVHIDTKDAALRRILAAAAADSASNVNEVEHVVVAHFHDVLTGKRTASISIDYESDARQRHSFSINIRLEFNSGVAFQMTAWNQDSVGITPIMDKEALARCLHSQTVLDGSLHAGRVARLLILMLRESAAGHQQRRVFFDDPFDDAEDEAAQEAFEKTAEFRITELCCLYLEQTTALEQTEKMERIEREKQRLQIQVDALTTALEYAAGGDKKKRKLDKQ